MIRFDVRDVAYMAASIASGTRAEPGVTYPVDIASYAVTLARQIIKEVQKTEPLQAPQDHTDRLFGAGADPASNY